MSMLIYTKYPFSSTWLDPVISALYTFDIPCQLTASSNNENRKLKPSGTPQKS